MAEFEKIKGIMRSFHPLEKRLFPFLKEFQSYSLLASNSGLKDVEIMRALQWLNNRKIIELKEEIIEELSLDKNGIKYVKQGLPEKIFINSIKLNPKTLKQIEQEGCLSEEEIGFCIGFLKTKSLINIEKDPKSRENKFSITKYGKDYLEKQSLEELFLKKKFPLSAKGLSDEERYALEQLSKRRQIMKKSIRKEKLISLTELGNIIINNLDLLDKEGENTIERLTPEIIKKGCWKEKNFRHYDIKINVPKLFGGKKQPYVEFIEEVRKKLLSMGFIEMQGPIIELEFFNFDSLFQPQNHPARAWSSTYRIIEPKFGILPDKKIVENVKKTHETGFTTGSKGWQCSWDEKTASRLMPRAHDTAISPRYLMRKDLKIPGKYFSLVRCYRPDVIDATHGVEFNQLGGFIIGKDLSFRHLLGLLKQFAEEITKLKETKFFPDYFPFTEPSTQLSVKHPEMGWMELAGAGVFRPELTIPLGVKEPVIAWGFGLDRLAMLKLGIKDIRELFSQDLGYLRESKKVFMY